MLEEASSGPALPPVLNSSELLLVIGSKGLSYEDFLPEIGEYQGDEDE